jgi:hypothetical protein
LTGVGSDDKYATLYFREELNLHWRFEQNGYEKNR